MSEPAILSERRLAEIRKEFEKEYIPTFADRRALLASHDALTALLRRAAWTLVSVAYCNDPECTEPGCAERQTLLTELRTAGVLS